MSDENEAGTNSAMIPWPTDPQGALTSLKRGGVEAAKRVNGDREKMKRLLKALSLIEAHAKARFVHDLKARQIARENAVNAAQRMNDKIARQVETRARELDQLAADMRARAAKVLKSRSE